MFFNCSIPNCVPELYRSKFEEECREYEQEERQYKAYQENKERLEKAAAEGKHILAYEGYPECVECDKKETRTQRDKDDDFCLIICQDNACECHKKYLYDEEYKGIDWNSNTNEQQQAQPDKNPKDNPFDFSMKDYKNQELLENLTVANVKLFAQKNYEKGGDYIIECLEDSQIEEFITRGKEAIMQFMYDCYIECAEAQATIW